MTTKVQFQRDFPPYNAGETAGLPDSDAARLQVAGVVTILGPAPDAAAPAVYDKGDDTMLKLGSQPFFNAPLQKTPGA